MAKFAVVFANEATPVYVTGNDHLSHSDDVAQALTFPGHDEACRFAARSAIGGPLRIVEINA